VIKLKAVIRGVSLLPTMYNTSYNTIFSRIATYVAEITGDHNVDLKIIVQLLIRYSAFIRYWRKSGSIIGHYISYLWIP
jgi:hypothetical protein